MIRIFGQSKNKSIPSVTSPCCANSSLKLPSSILQGRPALSKESNKDRATKSQQYTQGTERDAHLQQIAWKMT